MSKRDLCYVLIDEGKVRTFGNLKTLLSAIKAEDKYSTVWRMLDRGGGDAEFGAFRIIKTPVERAPYAK